jgi:hypothetical protein
VSGFHPRDFRRGLRPAKLTDAEYRVAVEMCEYAAIDQPEVWPSAAALADSCHMTTRAVIRIARRLEAKRLIARIAPSNGGRAKTNHWRLLETLTGGSGFSGAETLTDEALNPDPPSPETLTRGSGEVVKEVDRRRGGARAGAEPPNLPAVPDPGNAPPPATNLNGQQPDGGRDSRCRWCKNTGIVLDPFGGAGIRPRICYHHSGDRPRFRYATRDEAFGEFADALTKLGCPPRPEMFNTDGSLRIRRGRR